MARLLRLSGTAARILLQVWETKGPDTEPAPSASADVRAKNTSDREVAKAAAELSRCGIEIEKVQLWQAITAFQANNSANTVPLIEPPPPEPARPFRVRAKMSGESASYCSFADALASSHTAEDVIEWDDREGACAVDLDFHGTTAPDPAELARSADSIRPRPAYWWLTKSNGLRLVYLRGKTQTAETLAGLAALSLLTGWYGTGSFAHAGIELLTRTRFPPRQVAKSEQDEDDDAVRRLQGKYTSDDSEYREWLDKRGWEVGGRYPHSQCPANSSPRAESNSPPVCVHDDHVYCYVCAADGVTHGSHTPGYFPAGRLCGGFAQSLFALCVRCLTHWEHARHVLRVIPGLGEREPVAKVVYRAALLRAHGNDPRIPAVFIAGDNLIRYDGHWGDGDGKPIRMGEDRPARLCELPAAQVVIDGEPKVSAKSVEWLKHTGDVSRYGYPAVVPIFGAHVSQFVPPDGWRVNSVIPTRSMRADAMRDRRPRYLASGTRLAEAEAWSRMEEVFPRISRPLVELLVACKGLAETGKGMPPMIFLSGPSGAGKSATVKIAASMCGDCATEVVYSANSDAVRRGVMQAKKQGTFALLDEYLKGASRARQSAVEAMEMLLNLTPESESHQLYVGPVPMGMLPVMVWGDTTLPTVVVEHAQIARRIAWAKLPSRMNWEPTCARAGIPSPGEARTHGSRRLLEAMDSLLSLWIDKHFNPCVPIFRDLVRGLGFKMAEDVDAMKEKEKTVASFFGVVCDAPALSGDHAKRYSGRGWKLIDRNMEGTRLVDLWRALSIGSGAESRAIEETDIAAVCKLRMPARFEARSYGHYVYVRFAADDGTHVYNGELRDGNTVELSAERPGVHGPGDAECVQPPIDWSACLSHPSFD